MKKLYFAIPTWNRAKKLEKCIRAIATQIVELGEQDNIGIFVSDNCSTDDTFKVLAKLKKEFPFLEYTRLSKHVDMATNGANVVRFSNGEYVWIFGDDDILLKDGLRMVWYVLNTKEVDIIHAGNGWLKPHSYKIYEGTVLDFANKMGFNQFLGWITSVVHKKELHKIPCNIPPKYQESFIKSAFSHVLRFLCVAAYAPAVVIDFPIAEPMEVQTNTDIKRWDEENIVWKYYLTVEGLQALFEMGIIKEKLKPTFFRYLEYYLWDRFILNMIAAELKEIPFPEKGWDLILAMADMIDDPGLAKKIRETTMAARQLCETRRFLKNHLKEIEETLTQLYLEANTLLFEPGWGGKS